MVSGDLRLTIVVLIEQYLSTSRDRIECEQARAYEALPIFRGWDGTTLFLRHDGEILAINFELGHQEVRIEADPIWRLTTIVSAVERHPELQPLLPKWTATSRDCHICRGTGRFFMQGWFPRGMRCSKCCGLGWLELPD